jgi:hypothetical protein
METHLPVPSWYIFPLYMTLLPTHHNLVDFASCGVIMFTDKRLKQEDTQVAAEALLNENATVVKEDGSGVGSNSPIPEE